MKCCDVLTIGRAARHFGCQPWHIRRLFERNLLPPASRVGAYRVIAAEDLPRIEQALRAAGYLPAPSLVQHGETKSNLNEQFTSQRPSGSQPQLCSG